MLSKSLYVQLISYNYIKIIYKNNIINRVERFVEVFGQFSQERVIEYNLSKKRNNFALRDIIKNKDVISWTIWNNNLI